MKICIINNIYPPYERGGAEQVVRKTVEGLIKAGHEVVLLTSSPKGDEKESMKNLTIYRKKPFNLFFYTQAHKHFFLSRLLWHILDTFNFGVASWVKNILEQEKPQVVHTHNLMGLSFLIPRVIQKLSLRHIHTVHDVQLVEPSGLILKQKEHSWRYNGLPTRMYTALMKRLMGSPDVIISPSQFLLDFYTSRGFFPHSQMEVVRNPMTFFTQERKERSDHVCRILYLGQIENHKGILLLLDAFIKLTFFIPVELHIVGTGSLLERVQEMSQNDPRILVHGYMTREKLPELISGVHLTVVPSLCYENSPTVIFESLSFGVPVLASDIEGIAELIRSNENGFTFCAGDVESLSEKLLWCVEHFHSIEAMQEKTKKVLKDLIKEDYIQRITALYFGL